MRTIALRGLVRRLVIHEAGGSTDQANLMAASERITVKLHKHLSQKIGRDGYQSLLSRSLALTRRQSPELNLNALSVASDGSLVGLYAPAASAPENTDPAADHPDVTGVIAVIAQLFELLTALIGVDLTLRIAGSIWPEFAFDDPSVWENEK